MFAQERSLTELPAIGPSLAKLMAGWLQDPPDPMPVPAENRRNFIALIEARQIIEESPDLRQKLIGDLQMHSEWSDGSGSIREIAEAGIARGYGYISITDHTKGLKIAGGIDEVELGKQAEEIEEVNDTFSSEGKLFRVLRSVELNL